MMVCPSACVGLGLIAAVAIVALRPAFAQNPVSGPPTDRAYQGSIHLPDFTGRDRNYASYRTRIREGMATGADFAGHYAVIEVGCGADCRFAFIGDVSTGKVYDFPYGGEEYSRMQLIYSVKDVTLKVVWKAKGQCYRELLNWNDDSFRSIGQVHLGLSDICDAL